MSENENRRFSCSVRIRRFLRQLSETLVPNRGWNWPPSHLVLILYLERGPGKSFSPGMPACIEGRPPRHPDINLGLPCSPKFHPDSPPKRDKNDRLSCVFFKNRLHELILSFAAEICIRLLTLLLVRPRSFASWPNKYQSNHLVSKHFDTKLPALVTLAFHG